VGRAFPQEQKMDKMTLLILVVVIGFAVCWRTLRKIELYLYQCAANLNSLESTASDIKNSAEQASALLGNIFEHFEGRFPIIEGRDDPYPPA
jgi:hypothetical protein